MRKSKEIKQEAKEVIRNSRKKVLLVLLVYGLILILVGIVMSFIGSEVLKAMMKDISLRNMTADEIDLLKLKIQIVKAAVQVITSMICSLFAYGFFVSFVEIKRQGNIGVFDYFGEGFTKVGKIIMRDLYVGLIVFCWGILMGILFAIASGVTSFLARAVHPLVGIIVGAAIIIPLIVYAVIEIERYAMAFYLLHKDSSLSGVKAVKKSHELLDKEKAKRLIILECSFIGWSLLYALIEVGAYSMIGFSFFYGIALFIIGAIIMVVTAIIGTIHLVPYMQMATICFFDEVMGEGKIDEVPTNEMLV